MSSTAIYNDLQEKVIIITGGAGASAGHIGSSISEKLAENGAVPVIWDIADEAGQALAQKIEKKGGRAVYVHCDVREPEEVKKAVEQTVSACHKVDGLVNNAFWHANEQPPLHEVTLEDWDAHMSINLRCHFIVCKYVIPLLLNQEHSVILNIGSTGAHRGEDGYFAYSAAKAGLESLTRNIAAQYGRSGLRCNCLVPGLTLDPSIYQAITGSPETKKLFHLIDRGNLLKEGHAVGDDIGDAALFLLSAASRAITAQDIVIDYGAISHNPQWADLRGY